MIQPFIFRIWGDDQAARLKAMWWSGMTADHIALKLGVFTPQQIKDKAHREGFKRGMRSARARALAEPEPMPALRDDGAPVTMANVGNRECRWIYGEPTVSSQMCGLTAKGHGPWCPYHHERAFE